MLPFFNNPKQRLILFLSAANMSTEHVTASTSWRTFRTTLAVAMTLTGAVAQLGYVFRLVRSTGHGPVFTLLCLVQPVLHTILQHSLWSKPHIVEATDPHFLRMKGLRELSNPRYKQDIITGDIVQYILHGNSFSLASSALIYVCPEFRKAVGLLGDTDISSPGEQYQRLGGAPSHVLTRLASELPLVRYTRLTRMLTETLAQLYYAANSIMNPDALSLSTIATLHQSESLLSWMFQYLLYTTRSVSQQVNSVRAVYDLENVVHEMKGGDLPYPPVDCPHEQGMPFELKYVHQE